MQHMKTRRLAWLVNATAVDGHLRHALALSAAAGLNVRRVFSPEHGLWGTAQDMIGVESGEDPIVKMPVQSLYGNDYDTLRPADDALAEVDLLLVDLQDVGSRYYTYVYTAWMAAEHAARRGVEVWILDRPNPLGGCAIEGNVVHPDFRSFVGMAAVANRHAMTLAEVVRFLAREADLEEAITPITMQGWRREMCFEETGLPWVMPSPNMPTCDTAWVYPGQCLLEGTNLSEGRGTTRPFEVFGAPWLDTEAVAAALAQEDLPGCTLRPLCFQPTFQKYAGQVCQGFQLHVTERQVFRPLLTTMALLQVVHRLHPEDFAWRTEVYEFVSNRLAIDLLLGEPLVRHAIEDQMPLAEIAAALEQAQRPFLPLREAALLY